MHCEVHLIKIPTTHCLCVMIYFSSDMSFKFKSHRISSDSFFHIAVSIVLKDGIYI